MDQSSESSYQSNFQHSLGQEAPFSNKVSSSSSSSSSSSYDTFPPDIRKILQKKAISLTLTATTDEEEAFAQKVHDCAHPTLIKIVNLTKIDFDVELAVEMFRENLF